VEEFSLVMTLAGAREMVRLTILTIEKLQWVVDMDCSLFEMR
jgi:CYTH domain-containing protein